MMLFLHLLKTQNSRVDHANNFGMISLRQNSKFFETYFDNMKHSKHHLFLVTPLNEEAYGKLCTLEHGHPRACTMIFHDI